MSVIYLLKLRTSNAENLMIKIIANNYNNKIITFILIALIKTFRSALHKFKNITNILIYGINVEITANYKKEN